MPAPFPGVNVDPSLSPIRADLHLVLRSLVLYVARNDGYAPETYELADAAKIPVERVERLLDELVERGLARYARASCYPATRGVNVPPLAVESRPLRMAG